MNRIRFKSVITVIVFSLSFSISTIAQVQFEDEKTVFFASNPMSTREINVQKIYRNTENCHKLKDLYLNSNDKERNILLTNYLRHCMNSKIYAIRKAFKALMHKMPQHLKKENILAEFVSYPYKNRLSPVSPISGLMEDLNTKLSLIVIKRIEIEYKKKQAKSNPKEKEQQVPAEEENLDFFTEEEDTENWEFEYNEQIRDLFDQTNLLLAPEGEVSIFDATGVRKKGKKKLSSIFSHFYFIKQVGGSKVRKSILFRLFLYDLESWTGEDDDIHPLYFKITSKSDYTKTASGYNAAMSGQLKSILDEFASRR